MALILQLREGEEVIIRVGETEIVVCMMANRAAELYRSEVCKHTVLKKMLIVRDDVDFGSKRRGGLDSGWAVD